MLYSFKIYWKRFFSILFSSKKKCFILCHPIHPNLGDQAQLFCTDKWIKDNFPNYQIIHLGYFLPTFSFPPYLNLLLSLFSSLLTISLLKLKVTRNDIFLGHSGYLMVDHHSGWKMFTDIMYYFPKNKLIIFPQTINFYTPVVRQIVAEKWNKHQDLILLCRDEVSFRKGTEMFPNKKLLLYPDIVTSLIGTQHFNNERDGVLFCMRNDIEAFYKVSEIDDLMAKFTGERVQKVDTTIVANRKELDTNREKIIFDMISKFSQFKVVITDRYHGTIFSAIASTPVVVISSADHKLSSGVKWFPHEFFGDMVQYAENLDDAYLKAKEILEQNDRVYNNPPFFKNNYWDKLKSAL